MRTLYSLFGSREHGVLGVLVLLMVVGALMEVFGIGLLFPFIAILQDPVKITENQHLAMIYEGMEFGSHRAFSIAMGSALLAVFVMKGLFSLAMNNFQLHFIYAKQMELGQRLLTGYLHRPYPFFLTANTSVLIGNFTTSLGQLCGGVIQSALTLASETIVLIGLVAFLVLFNPTISLLVLIFFGVISLVFLKVVKLRISRYASENDARSKAMIRAVNESISAAKEIQILGRQPFFVEIYRSESHHYASAARKYSLISLMPRVALETIAVAGMVLFSVFSLLGGGFQKDLIPVLAVFAVATVRMAPSVNRILQAWNAISFYRPAIDAIAGGLAEAPSPSDSERGERTQFQFHDTLSVSINRFTYPTNRDFSLQDIRLLIRKGQSVAFIGHSGSGKTTLVDIVLGLFTEFEGQIAVDGRDIRKDLQAWQRCIGYIPQHIYLCDDTVMRNIAFGVREKDINIEQIKRAVRLAGLETVINALPAGLKTVVGDRGIRLSGGERQRIGIARALYHDPDLLVLDEATSALDNETERRIADSILGLTPTKTIIVIAHRLSTVRHCDCVYLMDGGRIIDHGRFDELADRHPNFVNPQSGCRVN